jgi:hypothetical protein
MALACSSSLESTWLVVGDLNLLLRFLNRDKPDGVYFPLSKSGLENDAGWEFFAAVVHETHHLEWARSVAFDPAQAPRMADIPPANMAPRSGQICNG